uniref:Secreted protein n=1 Tax=Anopheles culicifacies TaxID=139723 RepID=A0A182MTK3_9DIPT
MKLLYVCCSFVVALVAFGTVKAVPVEQMDQDGAMMVVMEDPMQDQQPLTLEDMVAVNDQVEMDQGEMAREKRHHRYGGYGGYGDTEVDMEDAVLVDMVDAATGMVATAEDTEDTIVEDTTKVDRFRHWPAAFLYRHQLYNRFRSAGWFLLFRRISHSPTDHGQNK